MPKFTELTNGAVPIDYDSVMAVSTYDGVSTYSSEQFTMNELQQIFLENDNPNGRLLNFDSSVNTEYMTDSNSGNRFEGDNTYFAISNDGATGASDYSKAWFYGDDTSAQFGWAAGGDDYGFMYLGDLNGYLEGGMYAENASVGFQCNPFIFIDNTSGARTNSDVDCMAMFVGTRNSTANSGVTNVAILGGVGLTADKDDYAFCENLEVQGGLLRMVHATENTEFVDAGSTGATEQDWIEVTVGGVTGYIRVYATK